MIGVILSWIGLWNDGSGTQALPLSQAGLFVITGGILPFKFGPEILLRGSVLALVLLSAVSFYKQSRTKYSKSILIGIVAWILTSFILLIQTWMAYAAAWSRNLSIAHSQDAFRTLSLSHLNSYWSNFQADRFFLGIGKQLETSLMLSSASVLFLIASACLLLGLWKSRGIKVRDLVKRIWLHPFLALGSSLLVGLIVGLRINRLRWHALDVVSILLLLAVFLSWYTYVFLKKDVDRVFSSSALLIMSFVGGLLLGWPVFLIILSLFMIDWLLYSRFESWAEMKYRHVIHFAFMASGCVMLGGTFAARSPVLPTVVFPLAIAWGVLAAAIEIVKQQKPGAFIRYRISIPLQLLIAAIGGVVFAVVLRSIIALAVLALLLLLLYWLGKNQTRWNRYFILSLVAFGWINTILVTFFSL